jgi:sporulation protein YlmC with PRC-barrel domain
MRRSILAAAVIAFAAPAIAQTSTAFLTQQSAGEWRAVNYLGRAVVNASGERVGDVNDLIFDRTGKLTTVVVGVGGFLGIGEKNIALGYDTLTYSEKDGQRQIVVPLTKDALAAAPAYVFTEKTTIDRMREKAGEMATKAGEKATELKDQAVKKIEEYRGTDQTPPKTQ